MSKPTRPPVALTVDQHILVTLRKAMDAEADGKALRRDLIKDLRAAATPGVPKVQAAVRQLPDVSPAFSEPRLREAVAKQVKVKVALSGKNPGVKFAIGTKNDPRGFRFAARRLNRPEGWRHPVFGRASNGESTDAWVVQKGNNGVKWFEPTILRDKSEYLDAVRDAVDRMGMRVAARIKKGKP